MKLSQTIIYAIDATLALAQSEPGRPISCRELALDKQMPPRYLLQILGALARAGILCSVRGPEGGYYICRSLAEITLLDIFDALEKLSEKKFDAVSDFGPGVREKLAKCFSSAVAAERRELSRLTLSDLVQLEGANKVRSGRSTLSGCISRPSFKR